MGNRHTAQSRATEATANALITFIEAWQDRHITHEEAEEIMEHLDAAYRENELMDVAEKFAAQLRRVPDVAPNRPMREQIEEVARLFPEARRTLGSDGAAMRQ